MKTLAYHNILDRPGERIPVAHNQVALADFQRQMEHLRERLLHPHQVEQAILQEHRFPPGYLITFDDGADGIIAAGRVLAEYGTAGVAFICPGAVKSGLWFYRLANALAQTDQATIDISAQTLPLTDPEARIEAYRRVSNALFDLTPAYRDKQLAQIEAELGTDDRPVHPQLKTLDEAGLQAAADTGGIFFANHSWSHPNLIVLDEDGLHAELIRAEEWLQASGLPVMNWFAYPRGNQNQRVRTTVQQHFKLAFAFGDGRPHVDELDFLPRIGLYQQDQNRLRFQLKLHGAGRFMKWRA